MIEFKVPPIKLNSVRADPPRSTRDWRWTVAATVGVLLVLSAWAWFNLVDCDCWYDKVEWRR